MDIDQNGEITGIDSSYDFFNQLKFFSCEIQTSMLIN
jgi:hypothetical protein